MNNIDIVCVCARLSKHVNALERHIIEKEVQAINKLESLII